MPITLDLEPDWHLVIFRHVGDVPDDELLTFYKVFLDDPRAAGSLSLLIDLEQTRSIGRSSQALRLLAELLEETLTESPAQRRVAVIAPADVTFGLARMYEVFSSRVPWGFCVFRDGDAARAWLGVDRGPDTPDPPDSE